MTHQEIFNKFIQTFDINDLGETVEGGRTILIRPIDGTANFMSILKIKPKELHSVSDTEANITDTVAEKKSEIEDIYDFADRPAPENSA